MMDIGLSVSAEGEGFKPPIPEKGIPDFESSAIDHSANLPRRKPRAKVKKKLQHTNYRCKTFHFTPSAASNVIAFQPLSLD